MAAVIINHIRFMCSGVLTRLHTRTSELEWHLIETISCCREQTNETTARPCKHIVIHEKEELLYHALMNELILEMERK